MKQASSWPKISFHPFELTKRAASSHRIYIIPTRFGYLYLFGIAVTLAVGGGYGNNLVHLIGFFMLSFVIVAMVETHNNLRDLKVDDIHFDPAPENSEIKVGVYVHNNGRTKKWRLRASVEIELGVTHLRSKPLFDDSRDVFSRSTSILSLRVQTLNRGVYTCRKVRLASSYPLGLFYAWTWHDVQAEAVVYPTPEGQARLERLILFQQSEGRTLSAQAGEDFKGHRAYQQGDSHRRIDWKAHARGRPMLTKEFTGGGSEACLLSWYDISGDDTKRLRQLAAWIQQCQKTRKSYALDLPGVRTTFDTSITHHIKCLRLLATYKPKGKMA